MRRFLVQTRFTAEGIKDIRQNGGSHQTRTLTKLVEAGGGKVECRYYTLGGTYHSMSLLTFPTADAAWASYLIGQAMPLWTSDVTELIEGGEIDKAARQAREMATRMGT
jgi:hypothetical protein